MNDTLRQAALEFITPYLAQGIPFVTMQQVMEALRNRNLGITITRGMLMDALNPEDVKAVKKIDGDRIVFARPDDDQQVETDQQDQQQGQEHVHDMAQQAAKTAIQQS